MATALAAEDTATKTKEETPLKLKALGAVVPRRGFEPCAACINVTRCKEEGCQYA